MGEFSLSHWLVIGVILLVFFGPSRLPGLGKSIGEAIRGFKKGLDEDAKEAQGQSSKNPDQLASGQTQSQTSDVRQKDKV